MRGSLGFRFFIVGVLTVLMVIPLILASEVINSRKNYSRDAIREVGREWGGEQVLSGPMLILPVSEEVTRVLSEPVIDEATGAQRLDANGSPVTRPVSRLERVAREPIRLLPGRYDVTMQTETEMRYRGIFNVPVYRAAVGMDFDFPVEAAETALVGNEEIDWAGARLVVNLTSNAALRGVATLTGDGTEIAIEPIASGGYLGGIEAAVADVRNVEGYRLDLGLNGAQYLQIVPVGRNTAVTFTSDWPHPSFTGSFLPDGSTITDTGFEATWTIPHLARTLPQVSREDFTEAMRGNMAFGVDFYEPNDFYQKAYRAAKYGILFIALTFLTVLLIDRNTARPAHPVQYVLIGLAQTVFVLLMVAYAEQIGFTAAYALSAGATILLITLFGWVGLKLAGRTPVLGAMLIVVYAVLYFILKSADYALIAGSTLAFLALAATMWLTRNEDWYGPGEPGGRLLRRAPKPAAPPPQAPPT
ncbi:cell envelope integrity protein CreD [uncultured Maritimibacter sp.]|jgi:inner membrane protein|uniref:cell envelope integrity protein CreD n=1 Tax=uncultured Maritimibacter sp. TaxID=991866 RepID=UPI000ACFD8C4|nr:cell envelope integrity protein CreD [uncultured Maritimibacter sp.]